MPLEPTTLGSPASPPAFLSISKDRKPALLSSKKEDDKMEPNELTTVPSVAVLPDPVQNIEEFHEASKDGATVEAPPESQPLVIALGKEATFYREFASAVLNDRESLGDISDKVLKSHLGFSGRQMLEKERDKLDVRAKQATLHLTFTDMRIKQLEKEVKKLRRAVEGLPEDFGSKRKPKQPVFLHELRRSTLRTFQITEDSKNIPESLKPALEILVSEQITTKFPDPRVNTVDESPTGESKFGGINRRPSNLSAPMPGTDLTRQSPERLRIRSRPLMLLLERICGYEIAGEIRIADSKSPLVLLRPFKLLVTFETAIRASVQELIDEIQKKATSKNATSNDATQAEISDDVLNYDDEDLLADLNLLIEFLDVDLKPTFELRKRIKDGTATTIEYQDLWHLFERGDFVMSQANRLQIYRVLNYTGGREPMINKISSERNITPVDGFVVDCYHLRFNGSMYGPKLSSFSIRQFRGPQSINTLQIYPLRFDALFISMKKDLLARGTDFLELTKSPYTHRMLVGKTLDEPPEEVDSQVIVDVTLAINKNPAWSMEFKLGEQDLTLSDERETHFPPYCQHNKLKEGCCGSDVIQKDLAWDMSRVSTYFRENRRILGLVSADELAEDDKLLLPHTVYGFVLRSRQWVTLSIYDLADVKYESNFDELVLPQGHKDTVKALVRNHAKSSESNNEATSKVAAAMDLVRGKGKGLIILLHGEPGVGKTSTAECVADLTQRPLFPITCGDIGETAAEVQRSLDYNFQLAHKWGCVLLLDEADVFLTKRNKTDLRRNAVVSVFLRTLEYYSGILFLTTNRIGSFDPAFKSRIHMSLFYPHLDMEASIKLYEVLLRRTINEQRSSHTVEFKIKPKEIIRFAKTHFRRLEKQGLGTWNGRQIRNAFQTAIALVEYEARQPGVELPSLGKAQFQTIAAASEEFDRYLKNTLGGIESDLARREQMRFDRFLNNTIDKAQQSAGKQVPSRSPRRNAKDPESEVDESVTDESEDEDDDEDEDWDGRDDKIVTVQRPGKATLSVPLVVAGTSATANGAAVDDDYEEFLRFKEMKKKGRRE